MLNLTQEVIYIYIYSRLEILQVLKLLKIYLNRQTSIILFALFCIIFLLQNLPIAILVIDNNMDFPLPLFDSDLVLWHVSLLVVATGSDFNVNVIGFFSYMICDL